MPIRSFIEFKVRPGAEDAFEAAYLRHGFLERARDMSGFLSGEFLRAGEEAPSFWATALWTSKDDYEAWRNGYSEIFSAEAIQDLGGHLLAPPQGFITEIVSVAIAKQKD